MQAIVTKYHGPGNVRGSRVSATAQAGRVVIEWDDRLHFEPNHELAAKKLCAKFNWPNEIIGGQLPDGRFVWVMIPKGSKIVKGAP